MVKLRTFNKPCFSFGAQCVSYSVIYTHQKKTALILFSRHFRHTENTSHLKLEEVVPFLS